ncbi:L,D-transpeptidase family protein [Alicycliphilus denitrificans]|uniref:L,D-transpeptidase family protein n=1 Tax=Alicycliphilus denitrificans TaxID=179636 RepID=UPI00384E65AF
MPLPQRPLNHILATAAMAAVLAAPASAQAKKGEKAHEPVVKQSKQVKRKKAKPPAPLRDGDAERRLLEISQLTAQGRAREALPLAERLVQDHPNFQLAQLALGDLLAIRARPVARVGDVLPMPVAMHAPAQIPGLQFATAAPAPVSQAFAAQSALPPAAVQALTDLRSELRLRIDATKAPPPQGSIPTQFLELPARTRHAIAMDASRSRLYLFENTDKGLVLVADYYASVGKLGTEKAIEGDQRTPLGVYFITSRLDPATLRDFYGAGALPINYPNPLDQSRGKTGSGIWLHGTPPEQFSRAPLATDGCLALANPDLQRILQTVEPRSTPVVIARQLQWVKPQALQAERQAFHAVLEAWRTAKSQGDMPRLLSFYAPDFQGQRNQGLTEWSQTLQAEAKSLQGRTVALKDKSMLRWTDSSDTMVVTFGEVAEGARSGTIKRQYWTRKGARWQIFFEGVIG